MAKHTNSETKAFLQKQPTVWGSVGVGLAAVAVVIYAVFFASADARSHSLSHVPGALALFLALGGIRYGTTRVTRIVLIVALLFFGIGQLAESIGAFGWVNDEERYTAFTTLHNVGVFFTPMGLFTALMGIPWLITAVVAGQKDHPPQSWGGCHRTERRLGRAASSDLRVFGDWRCVRTDWSNRRWIRLSGAAPI